MSKTPLSDIIGMDRAALLDLSEQIIGTADDEGLQDAAWYAPLRVLNARLGAPSVGVHSVGGTEPLEARDTATHEVRVKIVDPIGNVEFLIRNVNRRVSLVSGSGTPQATSNLFDRSAMEVEYAILDATTAGEVLDIVKSNRPGKDVISLHSAVKVA